MPPAPSGWDAWWWSEFLQRLDEAGYVVIRKAELTEKGLPAARRQPEPPTTTRGGT